jgi:hypothetical protein
MAPLRPDTFVAMTTRPPLARPRRARAWIGAGTAAALTVALAGCATATQTSGSPGGSTATNTSTGECDWTDTSTGSEVVQLAKAFFDTLDADQQAYLCQDYTFENAANWSNLPNALLGGMGGGSGRVGLQTDELSDDQWTALEELLRAVTGSADDEGFDEILQHLAADDYLADNGGGDSYGRGNYFIAFLGTPSDDGTWELQFGGHHLAVANTYTDGALAGATPSFRGIEPMDTVEQDGTTVEPEQQEQAAFAALLASLTDEQLADAELSESYNDILLGPGNDWAFPETSEGLKGSELSDEQQELLLAAIATYVDDVDDADAATILAEYEAELDDTYIAFSGGTSLDSVGDYIRLDGPSVWIEFSMQNGIVLQGAHPHAVWRDKQNDYGGLTS